MATIYIDNQPLRGRTTAQNLLHACLSLGFDLPYFCWHPALGSVGACRQCAVKQFQDEQDTHGKIVMACMTPAAEGTRISIDDPEARDVPRERHRMADGATTRTTARSATRAANATCRT